MNYCPRGWTDCHRSRRRTKVHPYLTTQLAELGILMILTFNMADDAAAAGLGPICRCWKSTLAHPSSNRRSCEEGIDLLKAAIGRPSAPARRPANAHATTRN